MVYLNLNLVIKIGLIGTYRLVHLIYFFSDSKTYYQCSTDLTKP